MNIYAEEGSRVRFVGEAGWDGEEEDAMMHLTKGEIYTVDFTVVGGWSSDVYLKEVPKKGFNTVMFKDVEE